MEHTPVETKINDPINLASKAKALLPEPLQRRHERLKEATVEVTTDVPTALVKKEMPRCKSRRQ